MTVLSKQTDLSSTRLLRQIIEDPHSAAAIQSLPATSLARLIDHVGLEDAGEIVSFATTEQLLAVFDGDLWRHEKIGEDDSFDPERFLLWLAVLSEAGEKALVSRLVRLPEELVIAAFYAHVIVLNLDDLAQKETTWRREDVDFADKALTDCLGHELDEYYIIARNHDGWESLLGAILALYEHEGDLLERILSRCCFASWEYIEENGGLYNVLSAEEMLAVDAAAERSDRRSAKGFVAPSDAAALFKLAERSDVEALLHAADSDPITRAYFRALEPDGGRTPGAPMAADGAARTQQDGGVATRSRKKTTAAWLPLLDAIDVAEDFAAPMLPESPDASQKRGRYAALMNSLSETDPDGHEHRVQRLIYLANVVAAGLGTSDTPLRPADAMKTAFELCDVGLAHLDTLKKSGTDGATVPRLEAISPVSLFLIGRRILSSYGPLDSLGALQTAVRKALN